jgi:hypothetical protein
MEKKQLINEIHRNLKLMGLNKDLKIYEDSNTKYKIVLNESIGSIGAEISQFLTRTGRQVFEEVPGLLDQYGNKVTKLFYEFGNYKISDDLFSAFQAVCNGTKKMSDLGLDNAKLLLDIIEDLNPSLITKFYDDVMAQVISGTDTSIDDILRALKKKVDAGANLEDEVLDMCGGDELLADVLMRTFKTKIDEVAGGSFTGTLEDAIKRAFSSKWGGVVDNLPIDKTIAKGLKNFLASDGWIRKFRGFTLSIINTFTKDQDKLLKEGLDNLQVIMTEILNGSKKDLKTQFRKLNVTLDNIDPGDITDIQNMFMSEIKKLDFNVGGESRKLTQSEIKIIQDGFVNNKVFGDDIGLWAVEAWNKSYYGKWAREIFSKGSRNLPSAISRFLWWSVTSTARKGSDWRKIIASKSFLKELGDIWITTTVVMKIVWPAVYAFGWGLVQIVEDYGNTNNPEDQAWIIDVFGEFYNQLKQAWAPTDSFALNVLEIAIPIHGIPAVKFIDWVSGVRADESNVDDIIDDLRERYPDITDDQARRYREWWERNKNVDLSQIEDVQEQLDNLGSTEEGFKSYCRLKGYDFLGFNQSTEIGTATVPGQGAKKFEWDDELNDFKQRN